MAQRITPEVVARIVTTVASHAHGATLHEVAGAFPDPQPPRRTVHHWLSRLVELRKLQVDTTSEPFRYLLAAAEPPNPNVANVGGKVANLPQPISNQGIPDAPNLANLGSALANANANVANVDQTGAANLAHPDRNVANLAPNLANPGEPAASNVANRGSNLANPAPQRVRRPRYAIVAGSLIAAAVIIAGASLWHYRLPVQGTGEVDVLKSGQADTPKAGGIQDAGQTLNTQHSTLDAQVSPPAGSASPSNVGAVTPSSPQPIGEGGAPRGSIHSSPPPIADTPKSGQTDTLKSNPPAGSVSTSATNVGAVTPPRDAVNQHSPAESISAFRHVSISDLPPPPTAAGAYVLINNTWTPLPRNNDRIIAHSPTLSESNDYLQRLDDFEAGKLKEKPMLVVANLTFDGKEPVPVIPAKDVTIVYVGLLAPPSPEVSEKYPELKDYPLIELTPTATVAKGARQASLVTVGLNLIGVGAQRIDAVEDRRAPDITIIRCKAPLPSGRYALLCGPQSYEVSVQ